MFISLSPNFVLVVLGFIYNVDCQKISELGLTMGQLTIGKGKQMILGAVTHFNQGWNIGMLGKGEAIGVASIRDEITWSRVETTPGVYNFDDTRVNYVQKALNLDFNVTLLFIPNNPLYDAGQTPHSTDAIKAFANFVKATLEAFPGVTNIEIGNEFNSNEFINGIIESDSYSLRDEYYMNIFSEVSNTLSHSFPDVKILGGAAHSIPVGYLSELFKKGALEMMDGVTIHPYTTPPEQMADQLHVLMDAMGNHQIPIYVTEFGQNFKDKEEAPPYLLKMATVLADSKVASADWYSLQEEKWFPNMELVDRFGVPTSAGRSFAFIQDNLLNQGDPKNVSPDSSSYFYLFGDHTMVLWGEPQKVTFSAPTIFYNAKGEVIDSFDGNIRFDQPIIAISSQPIVAGDNFLSFGTGIVADSYHDFDVTNAPGSVEGFEGPWSYFWLRGDTMKPLNTMYGGVWQNEGWTPYIGSEYLRPLMVSATGINPADFTQSSSVSSQKYSIVERFTAKTTDTIEILGHWDVSDNSKDGIDLTILKNGVVIHQSVVYDPLNGNIFDILLKGVSVIEGDTIDFIVGSNLNALNDSTSRRITIRSEDATDTKSDVPAAAIVVGLEIFGSNGNDEMYGNDGNDTIDGKGGADILVGGKGDDVYMVDDVKDAVVEYDNEGADTIKSSVSYVLSSFVENLTQVGVANISATGNELANVLIGNTGKNTLDGKSGADTMIGGAGDDTYYVDNSNDRIVELDNEGVDRVLSKVSYSIVGSSIEQLQLTSSENINATGNALANIIYGNEGNNVIDGGASADVMNGGKGDDTYYVDNVGDKVVETIGQGLDHVFATVNFSLDGQSIENLTLTGSKAVSATGNSLNNIITGNAEANQLDGKGGADILVGGKGDDVYMVDDVKDAVVEYDNEGADTIKSSVSYVLSSFVENLTQVGVANISATGNELANVLIGNTGKNTLDGKSGADTMIGGAGDDTYYVDNSNDRIVELDNEGVDRVLSKVSYSIVGSSIEQLQLTSSENINATGNALANIIYGNEGNNVIDGGASADVMNGGKGDDTYYVDNVGDKVVETIGQGLDHVFATVNFSLDGQSIENLTLTGSKAVSATGNSLNNIITGNAEANQLDGKGGADILVGGKGDDVYMVDDVKDAVVEYDNEGADTIKSSVSYVLSSFVENLTQVGVANISATGNELANVLIGNTGKNTLDGKSGADTMIGGAGDDTYYVDNSNDRIVELDNEGVDRVLSKVSYSIVGSSIEQLQLTSSENINATGNALANIIYGNEGNNVIDGGASADVMNGGKGDDTYYVDNVGDKVVETIGQGLDHVFATVNFSLDGQSIENLTLTGSKAVSATGNSLNNIITGNAEANQLDGKGGADILVGGKGDDVFIFSSVLGATNVDNVVDFSSTDDTFHLSRLMFPSLSVGMLSSDAFVIGEAAQDASDRIVYDRSTGALFFDRDGSGSAKAIQFAVLDNHALVTHSDFVII